MNKVGIRIALTAIVFAVVIGCGAGNSVKKADRFVLLEDMKLNAATQWATEYSDGFSCVLSKGTVVEAISGNSRGEAFFECKPVSINGVTDADQVEQLIVPAHILNREGFIGYAFALSVADLGKKFEKVK
jgi:hypothetical protein